MLLIDRVVCDFCYCVVGQLFSMNAVRPDGLNKLSVPPHFCVCPNCYDASEVVKPLSTQHSWSFE